jgi:hypothetical protein
MGKQSFPAFLRAASAAKLLDMRPKEFEELVSQGALPGPVGHDRWDTEILIDAMRGKAAKPKEEFDL